MSTKSKNVPEGTAATKQLYVQNCGFLVNRDEWGCRLGRETPWSFGTITVLGTEVRCSQGSGDIKD